MTTQDATTDRRINLTSTLHDGRPRTSSWLRRKVKGYSDLSDETARKALERDVVALRKAGVPIKVDAKQGAEARYWIDTEAYEPPEISFTPEEAQVLGLAGDLGRVGQLGAFARSGWIKLAASGAKRAVDDPTGEIYSGDVDLNRADSKAIAAILNGIRDTKSITFHYRPTPVAEAQRRTMDPWGVVTYDGRLYLVGFDRERQAPRCFRLRRTSDYATTGKAMIAPKPAGEDLGAHVKDALSHNLERVTARIRVSPGRALELRQAGTPERPEDPDTLLFTDVDRDWLLRQVVGFADRAEVLDPQDFRDDVVKLLRKVSRV